MVHNAIMVQLIKQLGLRRREEEYKNSICATPHHDTPNDWPSSPMFTASRTGNASSTTHMSPSN